MSVLAGDNPGEYGTQPVAGADASSADGGDTPDDERALVVKLTRMIREDRKYHAAAFKRMRVSMYVAAHGAPKEWGASNYTANIVGRAVRQRTASLYAKNPKATAKRRETMDFTVWDEDPQKLVTALQFISQAQSVPPAVVVDPVTGVQTAAPVPGLADARALVADVERGMLRRTLLSKFGRTLEVVYAYFLDRQNPLDFKTSAKKLVRRACTTGVGYIDLGFQREYGMRTEDANKLADDRNRLAHLQSLIEQVADGDVTDVDAEMAELKASITALESQPGQVILREGLTFDFPSSTCVIPDKLCRSLVGFVGARHVSVEYMYTPDQVLEVFGVDLGGVFTPYQDNGKRSGEDDDRSANYVADDAEQFELPLDRDNKKDALVCVWKFYDKESGLCYYIADGYSGFLREPAPPDIKVDDFWPIRALTFNEVEDEDALFPPSDVELMLSMQEEINRSRQGLREHRQAARPRWGFPKGALSDGDIDSVKQCDPFDALALDISMGDDLNKILQPLPVPGVDPNLYETGQFFNDLQLVGGTAAPLMGGSSKATATGDALAADSQSTTEGSSVDDLDGFLTWVVRTAGQILLFEMSPEKVIEIAGAGAVWPGTGGMQEMTPEQIVSDVWLQIQAGSSGKPNQAVEIRNWQNMLPFLLQMGSIPPVWLARETLRRLDDHLDLTDALVEGTPSIVAMNKNAQPAAGDATKDPTAQGDQGGSRTPAPGGAPGSVAPIGDNHM